MNGKISQLIVKFVLPEVVALAYAMVAWIIVYYLILTFLATATIEMAQGLALVASIVTFVSFFVFSGRWRMPVEH